MNELLCNASQVPSVLTTLVLQSAQTNQVAKSEINNCIYKRRGGSHFFASLAILVIFETQQ